MTVKGENNRQRADRARRERMEPVTYVHIRNGAGRRNSYPMRYLAPSERADFLARATSPL